jgi:phosphate transport system substrate-binding protein
MLSTANPLHKRLALLIIFICLLVTACSTETGPAEPRDGTPASEALASSHEPTSASTASPAQTTPHEPVSTLSPASEPPPPQSTPALSGEYAGYDLISRIDGSTATIPLSEAALTSYLGTNEGFVHNTTPMAYLNLIDGSADIVFCTYPSEWEQEYAKDCGVEFEIVPVVNDALVFLVNAANPITSLSHEQLIDIYTGALTNWSEAGGSDKPIVPFQRQDNSGSQTLFYKLVMGDTPPMTPPSTLVYSEMGSLIDAVSSYENGEASLGYSMFYYVSDMYISSDIRLLSVDGVAPDRTSIAKGDYPFVTHYYAVLRKDTPEDHPVREYLRWLLSSEGQAVANNAGYVTLEPMDEPAAQLIMYPGATATNTTTSSGTGGGERRSNVRIKEERFTPIQSGKVEPAFEDENIDAAIGQWLDETYEALSSFSKDEETSYITNYETSGDLCFLHAWLRGTTETRRAVFDLTTGKQISLSDLFFDGFNYIEYINSVISADIEREASDISSEDRHVKRPFTGYPNDFKYFYLRGSDLAFEIMPDDPFFVRGGMYALQQEITIPLTSKISPWGGAHYELQKRVDANGVGYGVPFITGSPDDEAVNGKIQALAERLSEGFFNAQLAVDASLSFSSVEPAIGILGDVISVVYFESSMETSQNVIGDRVARVDFNMATGEDIDPLSFIPDNWWEHEFNAHYVVVGKTNYLLPVKDGYQPPNGVTYSDVLLQANDYWPYPVVEFIVTEPEGLMLDISMEIK